MVFAIHKVCHENKACGCCALHAGASSNMSMPQQPTRRPKQSAAAHSPAAAALSQQGTNQSTKGEDRTEQLLDALAKGFVPTADQIPGAHASSPSVTLRFYASKSQHA
jgi:hypothetical protein